MIWGGFALFEWDNYFVSYMFSMFNKKMAYVNAIEITKTITPAGFVPNFATGGGYLPASGEPFVVELLHGTESEPRLAA